LILLVRIRRFLRREKISVEEQKETIALLSAHVAQNPEDAEALYYLGLLTCEGFGTEHSPESAFRIQQRSAALGCADAMFELYAHLQNGLGVPQDSVAGMRIHPPGSR